MQNSTVDLLCPLDGRRSTTSIYTNLIVSYSMVFVGLYQLVSLRKDPFPYFLIFTLICSPISLVLRYVGVVLYISVTALMRYYAGPDNKHDPYEFIKQHLNVLLFARIHQEKYQDRAITPVSPTQRNDRQSHAQRTWLMYFTLILDIKCLATIVVYIQRWRNAATTFVDDRLLELAIAGLLIAAMNWLFIFKWPRSWVDSPIPDLQKDVTVYTFEDPISSSSIKSTYTSVDVVITTGRDVWISPGRVYDNNNPWLVWQLYYNGIISFIGWLLVKISSGTWCALFLGMTPDNGSVCPSFPEFLKSWLWLALTIGLFMGWIMPFLLVSPRYRPNYFCFALWIILFAMLMPVWMPTVMGMFYTPMVVIIDCINAYHQLTKLKEWPLDQPCPLLRSNLVDSVLGWII